MILHMRHTLWTGISETNVNIITSATRPHAFNNNNNLTSINSTRHTQWTRLLSHESDIRSPESEKSRRLFLPYY